MVSYCVLKKKYHYLLIVAALVNTAFPLCSITDKGLQATETYTDYTDCSQRWGKRTCATKWRTVWRGPTTFFCVDSTLQEMYTSNNQVTTKTHFIMKNSFLNALIADRKKWPRLTELTLENVNVSSIIPCFFTGFTDLSSLSITDNNITDIVDGVFSTLENLQKLNLSQNSIRNLGTHSFLGLVNLQMLDLSKNRITSLPIDIFLPLKKLKDLDLSENMLNRLECNLKFPNLRKLFLRQNKLTEFNFQNITISNLEILDISQNIITNITHFDMFVANNTYLGFNSINLIQNSGQISKIIVKNNRLKVLDENSVSDLITELDLSFNVINNISSKAFLYGSKLKTLSLGHNNLKEVPTNCFQKLEALEFLDLSYNHITYFEFGIFNNLKNLKFLNITHNEAIVDFYVFLTLPNLENLNFEKNYFKNLDQFFFDTHGKLKEMTMSENSWNCSELTKIIHITKLKNIRITEGTTYRSSNIYGIGCVSDFKNILKGFSNNTTEVTKELTTSDSKNTSFSIYNNNYEEKLLDVLKNISNNLNTAFLFYKNNSEEKLLDVLKNISNNQNTVFFKYHNNTEKKLLTILSKIEVEIKSVKTFKDNNSVIESLVRQKQEENITTLQENRSDITDELTKSNFKNTIYKGNSEKKLLDVLKNATNNQNTVVFKYHNNTEEKLLPILDKIEEEIEKNKIFKDSNPVTKSLVTQKQEENITTLQENRSEIRDELTNINSKNTSSLIYKDNSEKKLLDVLNNATNSQNTVFVKYHNNTEEKLLPILDKMEEEIKNNETFKDNNPVMESLVGHKHEESVNSCDKFYVVNLAFSNILLLFLVFMLVIIFIRLKKPNGRTFREDVKLLE